MGCMNFSSICLQDGLVEVRVRHVQHLVGVDCFREGLGAVVKVLHAVVASWGHFITNITTTLLKDCKCQQMLT